MRDESQDREDEEEVQGPGALTRAALRAIDASVRTLQGWRNRLDAREEGEESSGDDRRRKSSVVEDAPEPAAEAPRQKSLLQRALIVLMCLLLGGTGGMLLAYRGFSRMLDSREALVEHLREEITQTQKDDAHSLHALDKAKMEIVDYRKSLRETQKELAEARAQIEQLNKQANPAKRVDKPVAQSAPAPSGSAKSRTPLKTGTCVTGPGDTSSTIQECLDKFNRP